MKDAFEQAKVDMIKARVSSDFYPHKSGRTGGTGGDNVLTGFVSINGKRNHRTYPCHNPIFGFKEAETLWSCWSWKGDEKIARYYFHWLLNDSPWAKTGITIQDNPPEFIWEHGFIFRNLDKTPANLLHNFLIASRMACEWPEFIRDWYDLVQDNIDPALAFLFITCFIPTQIDSPVANNYHSCFDPKVKESAISHIDKYDWPLDMCRAGESYVRNFLIGNPKGKSKTMFFPEANTRPVNTLWGVLCSKETEITYVHKLYAMYSDKFGQERVYKPDVKFLTEQQKAELDQKVFSPEALRKIVRLEQERLFNIIKRKVA